jgi:hypothetical protein
MYKLDKTHPPLHLSASVYRYFDNPATYDQAQEACSGIKGELATVTTQPQLQLLLRVIASHQFGQR